MRKSLLLVLAAACATGVQARHLTPDQALTRALGTDASVVSTPSRGSSLSLSYSASAPDASEPGVYVFNRAAGEGYLVVSADDSTEALLGYADSGTFDSSDIAPSLKAWIEEYARQVAWASANGITAPAQTATASRASISPMVTTRWNQDDPYYDKCPLYNGKHCYTGCVATAMAQAMKYHNWPEKGTGSNKYTTETNKVSVSCDFSTITFDWANMLDNYTSSATDAQKTAVADLMFAAGVSVDMDYTTSGSGAVPYKISSALYNYFGYSKTVSYQSRDWYGIEEWNDLVYNSLANDGPVLLGGNSNDGGHCFVCDGYSTDGYFHINWGWGGVSDGYFLLSALNPPTQGIGGSSGGYNFYQDATIGIRRPSSSDVQATAMSAESMAAGGSGSSLTITGIFYNMSTVEITRPQGGVEIDGVNYSSSGYLKNYIQSMYGDDLTYSVNLSALAPGTYKAYPIFKCKENTNWQRIKTEVNGIRYYNVTKTADGKIEVSAPTNLSSISVSDFSLDTPMVPGSMYKVTATARNSGIQEYLGAIYLCAFDASGEAIELIKYPLDILAGESQDINIEATLSSKFATGDYKLYLLSMDNYEYKYLTSAISVTVSAGTDPALKCNSCTVDAQSLDNIIVNANISNTGGYFYNTFYVYVYDENKSYLTYSVTGPEAVPAGSTGTAIAPTFSFTNGTTGTQYYLRLYYKGFLTDLIPFKVEASGIHDIYAPVAEASNLEVYTVSGVRIPVSTDITSVESLRDSGLAPGIYIVTATAPDGRRTVRKLHL